MSLKDVELPSIRYISKTFLNNKIECKLKINNLKKAGQKGIDFFY